MTRSTIVDPGMANALLSGRKTQMRLGTMSPLSRCRPGDRIQVREACIAGRIDAGQELSTSLNKAEFVIFPDGWRQYPDGSGHAGRVPGDVDHQWVSAVHMPRWASRMTLIVDGVRTERLQAIAADDIRAEGARPVLGCWFWRWPRPIRGIDLTARRAFRRYWNINHGTPGDRWEDDPEIIVLDFHLLAGRP
ncbi:hypothetical protein [Sphingobium aquiterrae]|uniref:hypothetical protein n=1 Tax=Sphingobium aquiterrae TaxID=2038656 RepID=UPI003018FADE